MNSVSPTADWKVLEALRGHPELLDRLRAVGGSELQRQQTLRREFSDELVRAALSLVELRTRAAIKFSRAEQMWFDRKGLEQSTAEAVARHKSARFSGLVWDFCCGIGSDAIALSRHGEVLAIDRSPTVCLQAKWNAAAYEAAERVHVLCADVHTLTAREGLLHIDPDRRAGSGGRSVRLEDSVPGLDVLRRLTGEFAGGAIKVSPAANFGGKFPGAEIELVSLGGECREATIWFGRLAGDAPFRATILPSGVTLAGNPLDALIPVAPLGRYLYEPDPAVVRAGLVDLAAEHLELMRLDEHEEYLTGDRLLTSPLVRGFEVLAELQNNERSIRRHFRESDYGQVEIKCRHIPTNAESLRRRLPLAGTRPAVLVIARLAARARAIVCRRLHDEKPIQGHVPGQGDT